MCGHPATVELPFWWERLSVYPLCFADPMRAPTTAQTPPRLKSLSTPHPPTNPRNPNKTSCLTPSKELIVLPRHPLYLNQGTKRQFSLSSPVFSIPCPQPKPNQYRGGNQHHKQLIPKEQLIKSMGGEAPGVSTPQTLSPPQHHQPANRSQPSLARSPPHPQSTPHRQQHSTPSLNPKA